jgi:UDP-N-acetylglucosamine/UDP-N-acetylgalactosamine diphosphorylase
MSSKAVRKKAPDEKLGVFALLDGKPGIVEYSELSLIESALGKGSAARFDAGNIAIHVLNLAFCDERSAGGNTIPLHLALKAIPRIGPDGRAVEPGRPNGYKFETFIFDALGYTGRSVIMEVRREEEFSPLKNRTGDDSPQIVLRDQVLLFAGWLESAGFRVPRDAAGTPRHMIEVSPLFALDPSEFAAAAAAKKPGERLVQKDTYYE